MIQQAGAIAGIVLDTTIGSSVTTSPMFTMSGDGVNVDDVTIPMVFIFNLEGNELVRAITESDGAISITIGNKIIINIKMKNKKKKKIQQNIISSNCFLNYFR